MLTPRRRWPGSSGCCAAPLSWCGRLQTPKVPGHLASCWRWESTWPLTTRATSCRTPSASTGLSRWGMNRLLCSGQPSGYCGASPAQESGQGWVTCEHGLPTSCGRRTPVPAPDWRTVGELLTDSDALARETLLDSSPDHAPAMVRSWGELVGSAADLW